MPLPVWKGLMKSAGIGYDYSLGGANELCRSRMWLPIRKSLMNSTGVGFDYPLGRPPLPLFPDPSWSGCGPRGRILSGPPLHVLGCCLHCLSCHQRTFLVECQYRRYWLYSLWWRHCGWQWQTCGASWWRLSVAPVWLQASPHCSGRDLDICHRSQCCLT